MSNDHDRPRRVALLLIAHGSRRAEANADLEHVAAGMRERGRYPLVQVSFLELAEPGIEAGGARCVEAGATDVILLPYFLSPGKHVVEDLTAARDRLRARFPGVRFVLAEPLGRHPLLLDVLEQRARAKGSELAKRGNRVEASEKSSGESKPTYPLTFCIYAVYTMCMDDEEFDDRLDDYLSGPVAPNPDMEDVEIVWVRGKPEYGADHIAAHDVTEEEVEEVLLEVPPEVEAKRHEDYPSRTIFWGATRKGRWLFISCEDRAEKGIRYLTPITAFEPEEGEEYWRQQ